MKQGLFQTLLTVDADQVQRLFEHDRSLVVTRWDQKTPLHVASFLDHAHLVDLFVTHQVLLNACNAQGMTVLHWVAQKKHLAAVKLLLQQTDLQYGPKTHLGLNAALHDAAQKEHTKMVIDLLEQPGIAVHTRKTPKKKTPYISPLEQVTKNWGHCVGQRKQLKCSVRPFFSWLLTVGVWVWFALCDHVKRFRLMQPDPTMKPPFIWRYKNLPPPSEPTDLFLFTMKSFKICCAMEPALI